MEVAWAGSHTGAMGWRGSGKERLGKGDKAPGSSEEKETAPGPAVTKRAPTFRRGRLWGLGRQQHVCVRIPSILTPEEVAVVTGIATGSLG